MLRLVVQEVGRYATADAESRVQQILAKPAHIGPFEHQCPIGTRASYVSGQPKADDPAVVEKA